MAAFNFCVGRWPAKRACRDEGGRDLQRRDEKGSLIMKEGAKRIDE
jgi:hypothetical protein